MAQTLRGESLTLAYDGRQISRDLSVTIPPGKITVIIGPNASGKSTLLRSLARLIAPVSGSVQLEGIDARRYSGKEFARRVGILPQSSTAPLGITVEDLVSRGRYPHHRVLRGNAELDAAVVSRVLDMTRLTELAARPVDELSGGQRQRVWIAMLLAQQSPIMLLDEPTTFLDVSHQLDLLELLARMNREEGRTVALVLHDLNQACHCADELIVVHDGAIVAQGAPERIMTPDLLREVFRIEARVSIDAELGSPLIVPLAAWNPEPEAGSKVGSETHAKVDTVG